MSKFTRSLGLPLVLGFVVALAMSSPAVAQDPCAVVDDGSGTVVLPPAGCGYMSPSQFHMIVGNLPGGTSVVIEPVHFQIVCGKCPFAGGICGGQAGGTFPGGEIERACTKGRLRMTGTGILTGFERVVDVPLEMETHTDVRPVGPVQTFDTRMHILKGSFLRATRTLIC